MAYRQTDRERQRYLTYTGPSPLVTFRTLYGAVGEAEAGLQVHGPGVLRTNATGITRLRAACALTSGCRSTRVGTSFRDAKTRAGQILTPRSKPSRSTRGTTR